VVRVLEEAISWVRCLLRWYIVLLMSALVVLTFAQVLARYLIGTPFIATDQLARIVLVWLTFMGAAAATDKGQNIRIASIDKILSERAKTFLSIGFDAILFVLLIILAIKGYAVYEVGQYQTILGTPFSYQVMYSSLVVWTILMLLFVLVRVLYKLRVLGKRWLGEMD